MWCDNKSLIGGLVALGMAVSSCLGGNVHADLPDCEILPPLVFENHADTFPASAIRAIEWIPLQHSLTDPLKEISYFYGTDSMYVIASRPQGLVQTYDGNGCLRYIISNLGQGPQEYLEMAAITATQSSIYVVDNFSRSLLQFSIADGSFVSRRDMPFVVWDIAAYNDSVFMFTCLNNTPDVPAPNHNLDYAVWQTDGQLNITEKYIPVESGHTEMYGKRKYFTKHNDEIFFHTFRYEGYFVFTLNGYPKFQPLQLPSPIRGNRNELNLNDIVERENYYLAATPYVTDNYSTLEICSGESSADLFANNVNHRIYWNSTSWAGLLPINIMGSCGNDFFGYVNDDADMYNNLIAYGFPKGNQEVDSILNNGGCALIRYSMR